MCEAIVVENESPGVVMSVVLVSVVCLTPDQAQREESSESSVLQGASITTLTEDSENHFDPVFNPFVNFIILYST